MSKVYIVNTRCVGIDDEIKPDPSNFMMESCRPCSMYWICRKINNK